MNERGEGSSTAIVAIVVLVLIALGVFFFFGGSRGVPGKVNIEIQQKGEGQPAAAPAPPAQP